MGDRPQENPRQPVRLFGFEISRELNLIALLALGLSMLSLGIQLWRALLGPVLEVVPNYRVNLALYSDEGPAAPEEKLDVLVNTGLTFINSGGPEQDDVIDRAYLVLTFGPPDQPRHVEYVWMHFEQLVHSEEGFWRTANTVSAHQLLVPGNNVVAKQISFAGFGHDPVVKERALTTPLPWEQFRSAVQQDRSIRVKAVAVPMKSRGPVSVDCEMEINERNLVRLSENRWVTLFCDSNR